MNALVMCLADPSGNLRPSRMIHLLATSGFAVDVAGFPARKPGSLPVRHFFDIALPPGAFGSRVARKLARIGAALSVRTGKGAATAEGAMFRALGIAPAALDRSDYDLIVVENVQWLPLAFAAKPRAEVVFDAREFYTREFEGCPVFRLIDAPLHR